MSFCEEIKREVLAVPRKQTCCRKAFVYGLLLNAGTEEDMVTWETEHGSLAAETVTCVREQFGKTASLTETKRFGHPHYTLTFLSRSAADTLRALGAEGLSFEQILHFRCEACRSHFLRGVFLGTATLNDPMTSYHLECIVRHPAAAQKLSAFLTEIGYPPKQVARKRGCGLYFKDSGAIEDILTYIGASTLLFECMNDKILRDIRNDTNRRANCETQNLYRMVNASQDVIAAIRKLEKAGRLEALPDELCEAARLRLAHPEAPLSEIGAMLTPPLSKSGVSHRLAKIREIAETLP